MIGLVDAMVRLCQCFLNGSRHEMNLEAVSRFISETSK